MALVAVALAITGATVTTVLRGYLVDQVDRDLGRLAAGRPPRRPDRAWASGGPFDPDRAEYYGYVATAAAARLQVGHQRARAQPACASSRPNGSPAPAPSPSRCGQPAADRLAGRRPQPTNLSNGEQTVFVRAISLGDVQDTTRRLLLIELLVGGLALVLMAGVGYLVVRRSLCGRSRRSSRRPRRSPPAT